MKTKTKSESVNLLPEELIINISEFLTLPDITKASLATSVTQPNLYRLFQNGTLLTLKNDLLQYVEQGLDQKAQKLKIKYHSLIMKSDPEFKTKLNRTLLIARFLRLVAHGEREKAEILLKKDVTLLLERGRLTDLSGRIFDNVSAFQYAQWALDMDMSFMLIQHIPQGEEGEKIRIELQKQDKMRLQKGLVYTLCRAKIIVLQPNETLNEAEIENVIKRNEILFIRKDAHLEMGYCYNNEYKTIEIDASDEKNKAIIDLVARYQTSSNILAIEDLIVVKDAMLSRGIKQHLFRDAVCDAFKALVEALSYYQNHYREVINAGKEEWRDKYWNQRIGLLQRELPAHGIHEYCRRDRNFSETPRFNGDLELIKKGVVLPRSSHVNNWLGPQVDFNLLPFVASSSSGLGVDFAIVRVFRGYACTGGSEQNMGSLRIDVAAMTALYEARKDDIKTISNFIEQEAIKQDAEIIPLSAMHL